MLSELHLQDRQNTPWRESQKCFQCYQNTGLCCKLEIKIDALNYIARSVFSYKPTALYYT